MMTATDYSKQAEDLLDRLNVQFKAVLVGDDCPMFCKDAQAEHAMDEINTFPRKTHIHGKHYRCELSRQNTKIYFDFWSSYAAEEENSLAFDTNRTNPRGNRYWNKYRNGKCYPAGPRLKERIMPTAYDLLAVLTKSDPGTFHEFCAEFGYDEDSRRAERTYEAVCAEWRKVRDFFTTAELELLQEIS